MVRAVRAQLGLAQRRSGHLSHLPSRTARRPFREAAMTATALARPAAGQGLDPPDDRRRARRREEAIEPTDPPAQPSNKGAP